MKSNPLLDLLKNSPNAPFYQCPQCQTVWLIVGGQALNPYTCKMCGHLFDLTNARVTRIRKQPKAPTSALPKAA